MFEQLYLTPSQGEGEEVQNETNDSMSRILVAEEVNKLMTQRTIMERYASIKDTLLTKIKDLSVQGTYVIMHLYMIYIYMYICHAVSVRTLPYLDMRINYIVYTHMRLYAF